jgi:hypothetical protein
MYGRRSGYCIIPRDQIPSKRSRAPDQPQGDRNDV